MYDDIDADRREDARRDAYYDHLGAVCWTCEDCGEHWDPQEYPATRYDQGGVMVDCCPQCGGEPKKDSSGTVIVGDGAPELEDAESDIPIDPDDFGMTPDSPDDVPF